MRRHALSRRQVSLAALKAFALAGLVAPTRLSASRNVTPPKEPCLLTRRLERGLRDDKAVTVTRVWRVEFATQARGFAVSGEQISVNVDAPARLAAIAEIEENRSTQELFPVLLGPDGAIMAAGENTTQASFEAAVKTAQELLRGGNGQELGSAALGQYLAQLQRAGSSHLDIWPRDLFYPSIEPYSQTKRIALPGGRNGEFELSWEASAHDGSGLLKQARRQIITRIGLNTRRSSEDWSLVME